MPGELFPSRTKAVWRSVPVDLIERMWPDGAVVGCSNKNLQRERLPLRVSTQLHRDTAWAVKSNCEEANNTETQHVTVLHQRMETASIKPLFLHQMQQENKNSKDF